ncbi:hypothetical protein C8R46DRAFT_880090, partial [Mycena filopes]
MPALEPITDSESDDSDDESVLDLLSVSDDLQSVSDLDWESSDDEDALKSDATRRCLNETFEDRIHRLQDALNENGPVVKPRSRQIGDLLAEGAKAHLEFLQPYPGDERVPVDDPRRDRARFQVSRVSDNDYLIWDEFFHELIVLPERLLREPNFELAAWYAARLGSQLGIPRS